MAQSPKGYWKYGLRITTPTSGRGHLPSLLDPTGYTSEEVAFREALAEILEWANNEIRHASGNYQKNLEHCLIELRKYDQLDLF